MSEEEFEALVNMIRAHTTASEFIRNQSIILARRALVRVPDLSEEETYEIIHGPYGQG